LEVFERKVTGRYIDLKEVKVKLSLCLVLTERYVMKAYWGVEV